MTSVSVFCEQPVLIAGLQGALAGSTAVCLAGFCSRLDLLTEHVRSARPDVILVEHTSSVTLAALASLTSLFRPTPVVLWVDEVPTEFVSRALGIGVRGILRRSLSVDLQVRCIQKVAAGDLWVEQRLCEELLSTKRVVLTPRELQLVTLLAQGLKNKELSFALRLTEGTVKVYLSRLFRRTGAKDRFELALFALKNFHCDQFGELRPPGPSAAVAAGLVAAPRGLPAAFPRVA